MADFEATQLPQPTTPSPKIPKELSFENVVKNQTASVSHPFPSYHRHH